MNTRLLFAHHLRAVAVMAVMFTHFGTAFFNNNAALSSLVGVHAIQDTRYPRLVNAITVFPELFSFLAVFGVAIFFLISGFVIPFSLTKHSLGEFWRLRVLRLWPVYLVTLLLTQGLAMFAATLSQLALPRSASDLAWQMMMGLQHLVAHVIVLDPVCWTLGVEIIFYGVTSLFFSCVPLNVRTVWILNLLLAAATLCLSHFAPGLNALFGEPAVAYLTRSFVLVQFMLIGTVFYVLHTGGTSVRSASWSIAAMFLLVIALHGRTPAVAHYLPEGLFFAWFAVVVLIFALAFSQRIHTPANRVLDFLANISYPLYLCHSYVGYILMAVLINAGVSRNIAMLLPIPVAVFVAWQLHRWIERPAIAYGARLSSRARSARGAAT